MMGLTRCYKTAVFTFYNGIMIRLDATEILRFHDISALFGKCLFGLILGSWGDFDP